MANDTLLVTLGDFDFWRCLRSHLSVCGPRLDGRVIDRRSFNIWPRRRRTSPRGCRVSIHTSPRLTQGSSVRTDHEASDWNASILLSPQYGLIKLGWVDRRLKTVLLVQKNRHAASTSQILDSLLNYPSLLGFFRSEINGINQQLSHFNVWVVHMMGDGNLICPNLFPTYIPRLCAKSWWKRHKCNLILSNTTILNKAQDSCNRQSASWFY